MTQIDCNQARRLLERYITGVLDGVEREALTTHVGACHGCRAVLEEKERWQVVIAEAVDRATPDPAPLAAQIRTKLQRDTQVPASVSRIRVLPRKFAGIGLLSMLLVGCGWAALGSYHDKILCSDAVEDHQQEVVGSAPRKWKTSEADIQQLAERVQIAHVPAKVGTLVLTRARICKLRNARFLHLVYLQPDNQQLSIFVSGVAGPAWLKYPLMGQTFTRPDERVAASVRPNGNLVVVAGVSQQVSLSDVAEEFDAN